MQKSTSLIVAANRDEFYTRPTHAAHYWGKYPELLAGKDLEAGGIWLGATKTGRFSAVTNLAETAPIEAPISRGGLALDFLTGDRDAHSYADTLIKNRYQGFNLLLFDGKSLLHVTNGVEPHFPNLSAENGVQELTPGYYGLSNSVLDCDWPKVHEGKQRLQRLVNKQLLGPNHPLETRQKHLIELLQQEIPLEQEHTPIAYRTGSCFIRGEEYGTRASTGLIIEDTSISYCEQNYAPGGIPSGHQLFDFNS